jgi:hypothetical protein
MKEVGPKTKDMVEVMKSLAMVIFTRVNIKKERFQEKVFISGPIQKYTMECGKTV